MQKKLKGGEMNSKKFILTIKFVFRVCFFILLTSFAFREPHYCKIAGRIAGDYVKEFAKPRRLVLTCYGGAMMDDIQGITLRFLSFDSLSVDEARVLYVEMMEEFLERINSHEKIRPFLHNFPFDVDNIKLVIGFENSERKITRDGHMAMIFIGRNHSLFYEAYNPITEEFYTLHRETYEEALKSVNKR